MDQEKKGNTAVIAAIAVVVVTSLGVFGWMFAKKVQAPAEQPVAMLQSAQSPVSNKFDNGVDAVQESSCEIISSTLPATAQPFQKVMLKGTKGENLVGGYKYPPEVSEFFDNDAFIPLYYDGLYTLSHERGGGAHDFDDRYSLCLKQYCSANVLSVNVYPEIPKGDQLQRFNEIVAKTLSTTSESTHYVVLDYSDESQRSAATFVEWCKEHGK